MSGLEYAERDVLKTILRAHGLGDDELLLSRLETFGAWIRDSELKKFSGYQEGQFPLVLLGQMGISGKAAVT